MSTVQPVSNRPESCSAPLPDPRVPRVRWYQWLLTPLYLLSVATHAKSFRGNPMIGSPGLNRRGLHVIRRRIAHRMGLLRRRQLTGVISSADRLAFERDGFIVKPNFLDETTFRAFRDEIMGLHTHAREAVVGDTL